MTILAAERLETRPALAPVSALQATAGAAPAGAGAPPRLELRDVDKRFGVNRVLRAVNLRVEAGEFLAVVGFSGSGKSTLVNLLGGLVAPDGGQVLKDGLPVAGPGPDRGMVFQSYSLMPWLTAGENVALAVDRVCRGQPARLRSERVAHYLGLVELGHARHKRPAELSGGMRQRVAFARALALEPDVLLLDEPLSALDALTRARLQDELGAICGASGTTVVLVTNDVEEALLLADRIVALSPGPDASLGPDFAVRLPRPRARAELNRDPACLRLRKAVTGHLLAARTARAAAPARYGRSASSTVAPGALASLGAPRTDTGARYVDFSQVSKAYPGPAGPELVVDRFDLKLRRGEFVSLIGHSGCGKSTVLLMAAGLCAPTGGGIVLDHREIAAPGPDRGLVFQSPCLVPWLTALDNVKLAVDRVHPHASRAARRSLAHAHLARVGLADAARWQAAELSNGMQQRVAIARALALAPKLLLLDEPFGMLDALTRWELQDVLMDVWAESGLTAIMVTHDVDEAILLADRVVMMTNGPRARVGHILDVELPRPRTRRALLDHPDYYQLRGALLGFLADCDPARRSPDA